ncbi:putative murein peptide carboxypeptidase [mine drainage metagenome]|uniref:Putative murein peptide carboxypeptidase n=1 Tax=mine drainage metagenome TaxID=410659 RepID=A0A1J5PUK5_9ZZZZ
MVLPPTLLSGDLVAIVSPSSGLAGRHLARLSAGRRALERMGFRTKLMPHTAASSTHAATIRDRVTDLEQAFADDEVSGVLCAIGGRGASQLLNELDYDLIRSHPKVFCGYSDATALHAAIGRETGLVTFYGPSVLMEFGDHPRPFAETESGFLRSVASGQPVGEVPALPDIVVEGTDWDNPHERRREPAPKSRLIRDGRGRGPMVGGCLPVLTSLMGTPWQVETDHRLLILDTPQLPYSISVALENLWQLRNAGALQHLSGLVVAWPFALDQLDDLEAALLNAVPKDTDYPVLLGRPFGHTSPFMTLPLGVDAILDGTYFSVEQPATKGP